jgi:hemoglobin
MCHVAIADTFHPNGSAQFRANGQGTSRSISMATLYERLGGVERITGFAKDVVERHYTNPLIRNRFLQIKDRAKFEKNVADFFCAGSGGPQSYTGKEVLTAHQHMNINETELVAAIDDVMAAMGKAGYGQPEKDDVLAIMYSLKGSVVHV